MEWWMCCVLVLASLFGRSQGELSVSIIEPSGPFPSSDPVRLQTEFSRNITLVSTLTYEIECNSDIGIRPVWTRNEIQITSSQPSVGTSAAYITESTDRITTLVLQNLAQSLVGTYVCLEGTQQGADSATLVITTGNPTVVPGVPQLALVARRYDNRQGLHALISASPPPHMSNISWFFGGNEIVSGNDAGILILGPGEIAFPRQVTGALMGTYTCVVNTTAGVENATFRVEVQTPPSLTIDPATDVPEVVVARASISITCTDTLGNPTPTFTWTHNSNPVASGGRITIADDDVMQSSRLTITSLVPEDQGTYQCMAVNPAASDTESVQLDVQYAPILSRVSEDLTTWVTGEDVVLSAFLNGANPPFTTHQVTRDSQTVTDGRITVTYTNESGSPTFAVQIAHVAVSDEGTYTLEVTNTIGTGRVSFTIVVTAPPVLVHPGTFFYAAVNSIVILNFTIQEAKPPVKAANITWKFNNLDIETDSSKYTQSVTPNGNIVTLTIRRLTLVDTGQFQAFVSHEALSTPADITINLQVKSPPNPPTSLTATFRSECSVLASWVLPGSNSDVAAADVIIIEHLQSGDSMWSESVRVLAVNNSALVRLPGGAQGTFNVSYQLRARSHSNLFGTGNVTSGPTNHFTVYREGSFPVVTNLTAIPEVPDGLKVSWSTPATDCFQFTTFDVRCDSFSGGSSNTFRANRTVRMASVSGLTPNTRYSCVVTSSLADMRGQPFDHRTISNAVENYTFPARPVPPSAPMEAPDKPPTETTITVHFTLPSNHEQISHYQVIVLRLSTKAVPPNPPDTEYPYGFDFALYEEINGDANSMKPYIAAEIAAEDFMPVFTIGESKTRDESGYLNGALQQGFPYTCFLRAFPRWLRTGSTGVVGRRQVSGGERQYIVFSSSDYVPVISTVPLPLTDTGSIAQEAVTGIAVGIVIFVLVLIAFLILMVIVVVVVRSSRQRRWKITTSPSVNSSEEQYSSSPSNSEAALGTPDLVRKMNGGLELQSLDEKPKEFVPSGAFHVHEFLAHVEKFDANRQLLFQEEFDWITNKSPWHPSEASNDTLNDDKNRYSNITAFDHTRVKLTSIEGVECSDYINANYIAGYHKPKEYITSQGPLEQTVDDFWRMVWEQNSATIVMLTNLVETGKVKCSQYWPNDSSADVHGSIKVTLEHSVVLPNYTIRNFAVESLSTGERRTVLQFHYTRWPDYGTPKLAAPLLNFLKAVRASNPENVGPIIVHCSAGVGRSGTVLAIDYCLYQMSKEGIVNIRGFISRMREQRNYMVQTEQQYTFIHYAILEAIAHGDTSFPLSNFPTSYQQLQEVSVDTGKSMLAEEYDRLTNVRTMVKKSSFVQRVKLKGDTGNNFNEKSNFRAHFVDSYLQSQLIVVSDGPTEESVAKFWQMVWDEGCTYIVMLTPQDEEYCRYWPNFGSLHQYGNLIVEVEEDSAEHLYSKRKILLTNAKQQGVSHRVQQYQFMGWTLEFLPPVPTFVSFLCDVLKGVEALEKNQRLLVHDTKSLGPSGIFCSLCYCVERLRLERMVDVFQAVQKIQLQRPGMVESLQDYAFIYDCMYEFIRTHSDSQ